MSIDLFTIENELYMEYIKIRKLTHQRHASIIQASYLLGKINAYYDLAKTAVWGIAEWGNFENLYDKCRAEIASKFNL